MEQKLLPSSTSSLPGALSEVKCNFDSDADVADELVRVFSDLSVAANVNRDPATAAFLLRDNVLLDPRVAPDTLRQVLSDWLQMEGGGWRVEDDLAVVAEMIEVESERLGQVEAESEDESAEHKPASRSQTSSVRC